MNYCIFISNPFTKSVEYSVNLESKQNEVRYHFKKKRGKNRTIRNKNSISRDISVTVWIRKVSNKQKWECKIVKMPLSLFIIYLSYGFLYF